MPVLEEQTVGDGSSMTMMLPFLIAVLIITVVPAVVLHAMLHII
jgi:hypothetical protein